MTHERKPFANHDRWLRKPIDQRGVRLRVPATRCGVPVWKTKETGR